MGVDRLSLDANGALEDRIGAAGVSAPQLEGWLAGAAKAQEALERLRQEGRLGFWDLPTQGAGIEEAAALGAELSQRWSDVVVLGIGGSSLGAKSVVAALGGPYHDLLPREDRRGARIFFPDNADPRTFSSLLSLLRQEDTCFLAITKSGGTAETLSQLAIATKWLGGRAREQVVAITDPETGSLRRIAQQEGWRTLPIPKNVGGRFSVLTAAGLLPVATAGFDVAALCRGADAMRRRCEGTAPGQNPAHLLAALHWGFDGRGRNVHVLFPYADALREVGDWYVQLWAESLGKSQRVGPTPLRAVGATDQHSLLQLLMEGPEDMLVTFVGVDDRGPDVTIPPWHETEPALGYLGGKTLGELIEAEQVGTQAALEAAGRPSLTLRLPRVDAHAVGELLFLWEAATAVAGMMYGVDPFDQPGVEASKVITQGILGRQGYEAHRASLEGRPQPNPAWILR